MPADYSVILWVYLVHQQDTVTPQQIFTHFSLFKITENGVLWWPSRLRIWHGHCSGVGSIPGAGTSACHGHSQK